MALHPTTEWPFSERSFSCMMQICTALHFMTSCWRRRGFNSFCYYMFNCVAGMVHSSEVKLGSAGVATFVLEQVPFFQRTYSSSEFPVAALQRPNSDFVSMYLWHGLHDDILHQLTKLWWGAVLPPGFTRLDVRYRVTQDIAAIHIHIVVMDHLWMIDRGYRVLRFHATQVTSIPTAVTGHHITPQVFSPDIFGPDARLTSSSIYPGELVKQHSYQIFRV